ncbi:conserved oligomeric Golgi complex subunit 2-like isoform X2 [Mustela lutreola]|uniref:conserved oligomeric Golgi complex subunit 2-like isoform X2 n=1 Tax=Mustela lutreola TaxID=9666 RepID=UPI0027975161|nr:conserved oligomeric Golgi complex subunit 2-like isoform X2 [Mustela lutreola]
MKIDGVQVQVPECCKAWGAVGVAGFNFGNYISLIVSTSPLWTRQILERIATEFNQLQFHAVQSKGMPLLDKRIAHITAMLQQSLGGLLLEGLQTSKVDIIWHCLQTYATIDKTRDAEAFVGQVLVKLYMDEVIVEQIVESHPDGLKIMYANKLLEFVPHHCRLLREVTGGAISRKTLLRYALPVRVTVSSATWTRFGNVLHINFRIQF